jgi:hypothetical protein
MIKIKQMFLITILVLSFDASAATYDLGFNNGLNLSFSAYGGDRITRNTISYSGFNTPDYGDSNSSGYIQNDRIRLYDRSGIRKRHGVSYTYSCGWGSRCSKVRYHTDRLDAVLSVYSTRNMIEIDSSSIDDILFAQLNIEDAFFNNYTLDSIFHGSNAYSSGTRSYNAITLTSLLVDGQAYVQPDIQTNNVPEPPMGILLGLGLLGFGTVKLKETKRGED